MEKEEKQYIIIAYCEEGCEEDDTFEHPSFFEQELFCESEKNEALERLYKRIKREISYYSLERLDNFNIRCYQIPKETDLCPSFFTKFKNKIKKEITDEHNKLEEKDKKFNIEYGLVKKVNEYLKLNNMPKLSEDRIKEMVKNEIKSIKKSFVDNLNIDINNPKSLETLKELMNTAKLETDEWVEYLKNQKEEEGKK